MPAYNAEKTISASVDSVLAQTYANWELIIINDCSKDQTEQIIQRYCERDSRIRSIRNPENMGVSETRHRGVQAAEGSWIAFLDSDDIWQEKKLEKQLHLYEKTGAELMYTGSGFVDADGSPKKYIFHVPEKVTYRELLKQNVISNSSVLIRRQLFRTYEIVGNNMHEDFACWLNILKAGKTAYGMDEPLLVYRLSSGSKSGNKWKAALMNWNTYRRIGLSVPAAVYYMVLYCINGLVKYSRLR